MIQSIRCKIFGHDFVNYVFVKDDKPIRNGMACKRCNKEIRILRKIKSDIHDGLWYFVDIKDVITNDTSITYGVVERMTKANKTCLKLKYKMEIHKRKGEKDKINVEHLWKNKKSDLKYSRHIDFCCDEMKHGIHNGFILIETEFKNNQIITLKDNISLIHPKRPSLCVNSYFIDHTDYKKGACHIQSIEIKNCPFCKATIEYEMVEKKKMIHKRIKVKKVCEKYEDKITEEEIL